MPAHTHLRRRGAVYYWRRRIPKDLAPRFARKELTLSLATPCPRQAAALARAVGVAADRLFQMATDHPSLTTDQLKHIARTYFRRELERREMAALTGGRRDADDVEEAVDELRDAVMDVREQLAEGNLPEEAAREELSTQGYARPAAPKSIRALAALLLRADMELYEASARFCLGDFAFVPDDPVFKEGAAAPVASDRGRDDMPKPAPQAQAGVPLSQAVERHIAAMTRDAGGWTKQTEGQNRMTFRLLRDFLDDKPVAAIAREDIARFKEEVLQQLPATHGKSPADRERSLKEILAGAEGKPRLTDRTVKRHLAALSGFFKWAKGNALHSGDNPAQGFVFARAKRAREQRPAWSPAELKRLFQSPIWQGRQRNARTQHGPEVIRDHDFWLPLIALYSGMRLEEIAQLALNDLQEEAGVWRFEVRPDRPGQRSQVKSAAGVRKVPVHPELIRLGLLEYRRTLAAQGADRLFPEMKAGGRDDKHGAYYTRRFGEYVRSLKIAGQGVVFHSFRKNAATALQNAQVPEGHVAELLGHDIPGQSFGRYSTGVRLDGLKEAIEKIRYDLPPIPLADSSSLGSVGTRARHSTLDRRPGRG